MNLFRAEATRPLAPVDAHVLSHTLRERRAQRELVALGAVLLGALAAVASSTISGDLGQSATPHEAHAPSEVTSTPLASSSATRDAIASAPGGREPLEDDVAALVAARARSDRSAWRESDFVRELRAFADGPQLAAALDAALQPDRADAERFAALRVAFERLGANSREHFARIARPSDTPPASDRAAFSRASVHWLAERALLDAAARAVLEHLTFDNTLAPAPRGAAAFALARNAPSVELPRLEHAFASLADDFVRTSALAGVEARERRHDSDAASP